MSEQILLQILEELKALKSGQNELFSNQEKLSFKQAELSFSQKALIAGQKELNQNMMAIRSIQEITHAKVAALIQDVRRLEGHTIL